MSSLRSWIQSNCSGDECEEGNRFPNTDGMGQHRPPPLRTSGTYDDDESFTNIALNMISRIEALGLTVEETIKATLISPRDRSSFLRALNARKTLCSSIKYETLPASQISFISPSKISLIEAVDYKFGRHLNDIVARESRQQCQQPCVKRQMGNVDMLIDRMLSLSSSQSSMTFDGNESTASASTVATAVTTNCQTTYSQKGSQAIVSHRTPTKTTKKKESRRFFPDSSEPSNVLGSFFARKRRVRNIDWKLAEAIQQVESLRLDGIAINSNVHSISNYEPPCLISMNTASYE
jgi:hypothetical protein